MEEVTISVQKVLLKMAIRVADILEQHDFPYMLGFGTLLGAVRHKGFIPWDDDFDFFLFDDTYDDAMELLRKSLPEDMFLEDGQSEPLYFHAWAHVKDLHSEAVSKLYPADGVYSHHGISVDLYRTKRMKEYELEPYLNMENRKYINRRREKGLIEDDDYQTRLLKIEENERRAIAAPKSDTDVFSLVPLYPCHGLRVSDVLPLIRYDFEGTMFFGPHDAHAVLRDIYGDYTALPPVDKRVGHYESVRFFHEE